MVIRESLASDRDRLRGLVLRLHETLRPLDCDLAPGNEILDRYFTHLETARDETRGAVFVAEQGERLVGYAWVFGMVTPEADENPQPHSYLADLYVDPEHRGSAVAELLMAEVERRARALGAAKIELDVLSANARAIRFYEKLGFSARVIVMAKRLDGPSI